VTFFADNQSIGSMQGHLSVSPDVTLTWRTAGFAGNVRIDVGIENSSDFTEMNYSNNNASRDIFIDGPDLTVKNIVFNPPAPVYEGQIVTITATVENLKPIDADNVRITFYANNINISNRIDFQDVNVPADGAVDVSVNWQTAGMRGNNVIFVEANTRKLPAEIDYLNNVINETFYTRKYVCRADT